MTENKQHKPSCSREPQDLQAQIDKALDLRGKVDTSRIYEMTRFIFDPQLLHVERGSLRSALREHTGALPRLPTDSDLMLSRHQDGLMEPGMVLANRKVCSAFVYEFSQ